MTIHTTLPLQEHQDEYQRIHFEVGRALSFWVDVEDQLTQMFHLAIDSRSRSQSYAVLSAAVNFNARLGMVDLAMQKCIEVHGDDDDSEKWKKLKKRASELSRRRNGIAHRKAVLITGHSDSNNISRSIGVRLVTSMNGSFDDPYDPYQKLKDGYSIKQVLEWQTAFNKLAHDIFCYYQNAREKWPSSLR